jgi:hypothetical protein
VFTVGRGPEFSIGRYLGSPPAEGDRPSRKWFVWGNCHQRPHVIGSPEKSDKVVLVEDLISAHKVGMITSCIPLFGTKVFDGVFPILRHLALPVHIWLDHDQEGMVHRTANRVASITGLPVTYGHTRDDPKGLSIDNIKKVLYD